MPYLITKDYLRTIQPSSLNEITSNDVSIRQLVEGSVEREIRSWLLQKFNLDAEFTATSQFLMSVIYKGNNRVYLDAVAYNATSGIYALNDLTLYQNVVYVNITPITVPEAFNATKWTSLGNQFDLFFITLPQPLFDQNTIYKRGDKVWWRDKVYTAVSNSPSISQQNQLQAETLTQDQYVIRNPLPDDSVNGPAMWGTGVAYSVSAGTLPTNTTYWTKGDNRNQMFVSMMLDMVVYELCKRIAPNNVPEARHNAWLRACQNLKAFADGKINAQLPVLQPKVGNRVRYGSKPKRINDW